VPHPTEFGNSLDGELFTPESPGYDAIRRPVNVAYGDVRPQLVVRCRSVLTQLGEPRPTGRRELAFTAIGGAYNRVAEDATAFSHRSERFLLEHIAEAADPWVDGSWATAHADGSGRVYPNFPDPALDDWAVAYHAGNHPRLAAVKNAYDRHRCFEFPQAI
jgi:hypothetical protein